MLGRLINRFEEAAIAYLLLGMVAVTFSQVVARYVFNTGAVWALELTTTLFAWLVLFGVSYGVKVGAHLGVDAFVRLFPASWQRALILLSVACCLAYAAIFFLGAWDYVSKMYRFGIGTEDLKVPRLIVEWLHAGEPGYVYEEEPVPRWLRYLILPIGLGLLLFRFLEAGIDILRGRRGSLIAAHEVEDAIAEHAEADEAAPADREPGR